MADLAVRRASQRWDDAAVLPAYKRLILSHHKDLNRGDYLIDDRPHNGARSFHGELIVFGSPQFPDWDAVLAHLDVQG